VLQALPFCLERSGAVEACAGVGTCRRLPQELRSSGGALQECRRGDVRLKRSGALVVCCRCRDVESLPQEVWRYAAGVLPLRGMELWSS